MLSEAQILMLGEVVQVTWDAIGHDCFKNDLGKHDPSMTFSANEVVELCLDGDRWRRYINRTGLEEKHFEPIVQHFFKQKWGTGVRESIIRRALPHEEYRY